ncbi:MAG TPA: hypothetical protein VFX03_01190, partial [Thermomicrobiales bacterium]|nr:hypothetical protein [Thermomicrobiales bacterium]
MVPATWILMFGVLAADGPAPATALAKAKADAAPAKTAKALAPAEAADRRDVLLLLDGGPLHLRLHLSLGGVSLAEARRRYIGGLI